MGALRYGVDRKLEDEADRLIKESLAGVTSQEAKRDILTPWKQQDRWSREVYVADGVPDPSVRRGNYHRAWNPRDDHLNSRDAGAMRGRRTQSSLGAFVAEQGIPFQSEA